MRRCFSDHARAERHKPESCELEILLPERDADDRDIQYQPGRGARNGHPETDEEEPEDIRKQGDRAAAVNDFFTERAERQLCKFEALHAERDPDDRDAEQNACQNPAEPCDKSPEDKP